MRIVSLIPEATEILHAIGLKDEVVVGHPWDGRTTHVFTSETAAGGGMPRQLVRRQLALSGQRPRPSVYALEPTSLGEILSDIKTVGDAVGRQGAARGLIEALRVRIDAVSLRSARAVAERGPLRVACLSGPDDAAPMAAGTWLAELVGLAGGIDVLDGVGRPARAVTWDEIRAARPDLVLPVGDVHPGPGAVSLMEQLADRILHAPVPRT